LSASYTNIKVGSRIIECGKVYTVYKIEERLVGDKTQRIIFYKPHFVNSNYGTVICSMPEDNLTEANVRQPISTAELKEIIGKLSAKPQELVLDAIDAKLTLNGNDIYKSVEILKVYWKEKNENKDAFSKSKKDILELAFEKVIEEVAVVKGVTLDAARLTLTSALG